jgi:hypothetical protein
VDVVWLRDPLPIFSTGVYSDKQLISQSEQAFGSNCGFYLARASNTTVRFMTLWLEDMVGPNATWKKKGQKLHEQNSYIRVLNRMRHRRFGPPEQRLTHTRFNESQFPNGKIWFQHHGRTSKRDAVVIHSNWIQTAKKKKLRRDNLWFLDRRDAACAADFDPLAAGCDHHCVPVTACALDQPCEYMSCAAVGEQVRRHRARQKGGTAWHPMALAFLGCGAGNESFSAASRFTS